MVRGGVVVRIFDWSLGPRPAGAPIGLITRIGGGTIEVMQGAAMSQRDGGCTCGQVRYRMSGSPLFVHCCHCRWCQRESGSAFAHNALIEADRVALLRGQVAVIATPSASGRGQRISRCPRCRIALWSNYFGAGDAIHFVRVGTLDEPDRLPPDIHIFTASKQPWVTLAPGIPAVKEFYRPAEHWPKASLERYALLQAKARGQ